VCEASVVGFRVSLDLLLVPVILNQNVTPNDWLQGDLTGDGFVGIEDLNVVLGNWNAGTPPGADQLAVPEPGTAIFVLLGILAARRRR